MKQIDEALALILSRTPLMPPVETPLADALGRVLRGEIVADMDSPPFDCSSMDGYALRAADAGKPLEIVAEIQAGVGNPAAISVGQCARIFTGAKIPEGADCVLMQEEAALENGKLVSPQIPAGENIRRQGENCRKGDLLLKPGVTLSPGDLAVLASCGATRPKVGARPRVVHFVTGDELVDPSQTPSGGQIRDCNSTLVAALLAQHGAELVNQLRLPDNFEKSIDAVANARDFDVLLISGGASVGAYDFARPLLEKAGFEILLSQINMRPGKPLIFAARGKQLAFGLPGNPVSHAAIFYRVLAPVLEAMLGATPAERMLEGRMGHDFSSRPNPRETYWPCHAAWRDGAFRLRALRFQSSGDITGIAGMNALLRIPSGHPGMIKEGEPAGFLWLRPIV
ncbi:MAG TPA: molybdopterin molybdotransferase MoeA [Chthoniobacteraceae bacterium]|nr:molybdopterin molybdotransferase MoeA [Chthoniobacteraceae bacterium]